MMETLKLDKKARVRLHDFVDFIDGWNRERVDKRMVLVTLITTSKALGLGFPMRVRGYSYRMKSDKENQTFATAVAMGRALKNMDRILSELVEEGIVL
jgi:hypothetical protein